MKLEGSIESVEIDARIVGIKLIPRTDDLEISFDDGGKLMVWKDSYVALGMPTVWDGVKIVLSTRL